MHVYVYVRQGSYITNVNILKTESNEAFHVFPQARYDFPGGSESKASVYNTGDLGSFSRLGRFPGEGNSNPLQYSCLENPMKRGAWQAIVHGVTKSGPKLHHFTFHFLQIYCFYPIMPANLGNSAVATGLEKVSFHLNPKEKQC